MVCLLTLRTACYQQTATLGEILWRKGVPEFTLQTAEFQTDLAQQTVNCLVQTILPLYVCALNGTESYLLSEHYHKEYVGNVIGAQINHLCALRMRSEANDPLRAACLFWLASTKYTAARKSAYGDSLEGVCSLNRKSSALVSLAQHLVSVDEENTSETQLLYPASTTLLPGTALLEAYHCVRAATAIRGGQASVLESECDNVERLLQTKYNVRVPTRTIKTRGVREYQSISIVPNTNLSAGLVLCEHTRPFAYTVAIGVIDRLYQLPAV
jgi:hypothetical protein